jgi:UDP-2,3-diacylglucosamine hydrolase
MPGDFEAMPDEASRTTPSNTPARRIGATVSDLHILTERSSIDRHMAALDAAADRVSMFVFNGDIFDFRWSQASSFRKSIDLALKWIERLLQHNPHCRFVFTIGNHDNVAAYQRGLAALAKSYDNFDWARFWVKLEDKFFLHGDVVDRRGTPEHFELRRSRWDSEIIRGPVANKMYGAVTAVGVHRLASRMISRRKCARRILAYARHVLHHRESELRDIYFGHIHTSFVDFEYAGRRFHNSGAAIEQLHLHIIEFPIADRGTLEFGHAH